MSQPNFDDLVAGAMMATLGEEIPRMFTKAERRLRQDEKALVHEGKGPAGTRRSYESTVQFR